MREAKALREGDSKAGDETKHRDHSSPPTTLHDRRVADM